jgi:hypothetical protein
LANLSRSFTSNIAAFIQKRADVSSPLRAIMAKWLFHFGNHLFDLAKAGGSCFQALFELFNLGF